MSVERRMVPRSPVRTEVEINVSSEGMEMVFPGETVNISSKGVEIACDDVAINAVVNQEVYPQYCEISFTLPELKHRFNLEVRVANFRRLSKHEYRLIVLFESLPEKESSLIMHALAGLRYKQLKSGAIPAIGTG